MLLCTHSLLTLKVPPDLNARRASTPAWLSETSVAGPLERYLPERASQINHTTPAASLIIGSELWLDTGPSGQQPRLLLSEGVANTVQTSVWCYTVA